MGEYVCVCVCVCQGNDSQLMKKWMGDLIQPCFIKQAILDIEAEKACLTASFFNSSSVEQIV